MNWLEDFFGAMATGDWVVPLNFRFTDDDIRYCANVAEPAVFIMEEEYARGSLRSVRTCLASGALSAWPVLGRMEDMEKVIGKAYSQAPGMKSSTPVSPPSILPPADRGPKGVLHRQMMLVGSAVYKATDERWTHESLAHDGAPLSSGDQTPARQHPGRGRRRVTR